MAWWDPIKHPKNKKNKKERFIPSPYHFHHALLYSSQLSVIKIKSTDLNLFIMMLLLLLVTFGVMDVVWNLCYIVTRGATLCQSSLLALNGQTGCVFVSIITTIIKVEKKKMVRKILLIISTLVLEFSEEKACIWFSVWWILKNQCNHYVYNFPFCCLKLV